MFQRRYEREIIVLDGTACTGWTRRSFENSDDGTDRNWFHVEQNANRLWTMRLRRSRATRGAASLALRVGQSPGAAGILGAFKRPPGNLWKCRNWSSSFTITSFGSRSEERRVGKE